MTVGPESQRLGRSERIKKSADFRAAYERGRRCSGRFMTVFVLQNGLPVSRIGIAATRKLGGAVERNRAKRLARELFRRNKPGPGFDIIVVARRDMLDAPFSLLEHDYRESLRRRPRAH